MKKVYSLLLPFFVVMPALGMKRSANHPSRADQAAVAVSAGGGAAGADQEPHTPPSSPRRMQHLVSPNEAISPSQWRTVPRFTANEDVLGVIIEHIDQTPATGYIGVDNPYVTNSKIIQALIRAAAKGTEVVVNLSPRSKQKNIKKLQDADGIAVRVHSNVHSKRCLIAYKKPETDSPSRNDLVATHVFVGSHNMSDFAPHHKEVMNHTQNDTEFFMQNYKNHRALAGLRSPLEKKEVKAIQLITPEKRTMTSSHNILSTGSRARRISSLLRSSNPNDSLDISSMTFNAEDIVQAVEQVKAKRPEVRVRLFLDKDALRNKELLTRLERVNALVYIFNHEKDKKVFDVAPQLQHTKILARRLDDSYLVVTSTGNLTGHSDDEHNVDSYHPSDKKLFEETVAAFDKLATESVQFKDISQS